MMLKLNAATHRSRLAKPYNLCFDFYLQETGSEDLPPMNQSLKRLGSRIIVKLAERVAQEVGRTLSVSDEFADSIAYRVALETMLDSSALDKNPNELFSQISDGFGFWLCTEGYRRSPLVRKSLPSMTDNAR